MAIAGHIRLGGVVTEVKSARLVVVELPNGHRLFGHGTRADAAKMAALRPGEAVCVELSPADMSAGRLRFNETRQTK
jgi:translation initiation factor IF-1